MYNAVRYTKIGCLVVKKLGGLFLFGVPMGIDMTLEELKEYLEPRLSSIEKKIDLITNPMIEDIKSIDKTLSKINEEQKLQDNSILTLDGRISVLEDNKESKKVNTQTVLLVIGLVFTTSLGIVGWLI